MKLHYKTFGQGDPIIILHGLFGMLDNWQTIGKKLAEHYQVFLVDLRNHGRSLHDDQFNYQVMAQDVERFMLSQWIHHATVIGHSMGGKVALQLATHHPDLVDRLIVVDMGIKENKHGHEMIFDALRSVDIEQMKSRSDADAVLAPMISDIGTRLFLMKNLSRDKTKVYKWKMNLDSIYKNYDEVLKPIFFDDPFDNPTLFIRGEQSNYITDEDWVGIQTNFKNAQLVTIKNAGHWVHADQPAELLKAVNEWMGDNDIN